MDQLINLERDNNLASDYSAAYIPFNEQNEIVDFNLNDYGENELKQLKSKIE